MLERASRLIPQRARRAHKAFAWLFAFFWIPCPICGAHFGGHERRGIGGKSSTSDSGKGICAACTRAGRGAGDKLAIPGVRRDSLDFQRGVEYGLLFTRVKYGSTVAEWPVHADLAEHVIFLAESRGLLFSAKPHGHGDLCEECVGRHDCRDGEDWLDVSIGYPLNSSSSTG